ncbi:hypothetical protein HPB48_010582 [Haemaphysalis longicornis]|uniref:Uncharacterized protein n=1 Tax=Haemaphysalis longicornis TaxID=44386 RepID=A0A9J6H3B2_HAELO|nr:hypothetical protein HPB48_010582 [Haemaphysalis longicornis]
MILYACAVSVVLVVIAILALVVWMMWGPPKRICTSDYCRAHAALLKAALNRSVDPCDDFYKFTCGSWKPKGQEKSMIGYAFAQTERIAIQEMNGTTGSLIAAAPIYYQSCLTKANPTNELDMFKHFKQGLGLMWPEAPQGDQPHPLVALLNMTINWNYHMFFHLRAFPEYRKRPPTLYIRRGRLSPKWQDMGSKEFSEVVDRHFSVLGVNSGGDTHEELYDVITRIMYHAISIPPDATNDTQFPLKEAFAFMKHNSGLLRSTVSQMLEPEFHWHDSSPVFIEDASILTQLDKLLKEYEKNVPLLMQGLSWVFIRDNLWVVVGKPRLRHSGDEAELQMLLMRACLKYVESSFGLVALAKHIHARYDDDMKKKLEATFSGVREELIREVDNASWIDRDKKREIEGKVTSVGFNALPEESFFFTDSLVDLYSSFSASVSGSFMQSYINLGKAYRSILGTEKFVSIYSKRSGGGNEASRYNYYYNIAFLSLGAMQPPVLYPGGMLAVTFGSLGTLLADCIVRSFDTHGVRVDEKGEARHWWGPDWPGYRERVECDLIGDSFARGPEEEFKRRLTALFPVAPALNVSFKAFRLAVAAFFSDTSYEDTRLPGLEDYSDDQLFFMTYCLMRCRVGGYGHECNLPVRHAIGFASAFGCKPGSRMNPVDKCGFLV